MTLFNNALYASIIDYDFFFFGIFRGTGGMRKAVLCKP